MTGFSGTTAECLVDFGTRYPGMEGRRLLAKFCQVVVHPTTREWTSGERVPKGETLLRVRAFLALAGYTVSEVEDLPRMAQQFMMLMATDVVKIEDAQRELSYKNVDGLYDITLRAKSPLRDKAFRLEELLRQNSTSLQEVLDTWRSDIAGVLSAVQAPSGAQDDVEPTGDESPSIPLDRKPRSRVRKRVQPKLPVASNSSLSQGHDEESVDVTTARAVAHLIDAMGTLVAGRQDVDVLITAVARRAGHKQLSAAYLFLGAVAYESQH